MINTIAPHGPPTQTPPDRPAPGGKGADPSFDDFLSGKQSAGVPSPIEDHSPPPTLPEDTGDEVPPEPLLHRPMRLKNAKGTGTEPVGTEAAAGAAPLPTQIDLRSMVPAITLSPAVTASATPSTDTESSVSSESAMPGSSFVGSPGGDPTDRSIRANPADKTAAGGAAQVLNGPSIAATAADSKAAETGMPGTDWVRVPYGSGALPTTDSTATTGPVTPPVVPTTAPLSEEMPDLPPRLAPLIQPSPTSRVAPLSTGSEAPRWSGVSDTIPTATLPDGVDLSVRLPVATGDMDLARAERAASPRAEVGPPPSLETNAPTDFAVGPPEVDAADTGQTVPSPYSINTSRAVLPSRDTHVTVVPPAPDSRLASPNPSTAATPDVDPAATSMVNLPNGPTISTTAGIPAGTVTAPSLDANPPAATHLVATPQAENSGSPVEDKAKIADSWRPEIRTAKNLEGRVMQPVVDERTANNSNSSGTPVAKEDAAVTATSPTEEKENDLRPLAKRGSTGPAAASVPARKVGGDTLSSEALVSNAVSGVSTSSAPSSQVAGSTAPDATAARQVVKVETLLQNALSAGAGLRPSGQGQLEMRVNLGNSSEDVTVRMQVANDRMQVTFQTDSPELRKALEHGWEQLSGGSTQNSGLSLAPTQFEPGRAVATVQNGQTDAQTSFSGQQNSRRQDDAPSFGEESARAGAAPQPGRANTASPIPVTSRETSRRWSGWA